MKNQNQKSFGIAMVLASTLVGVMAGCGLYFGDSNSQGGWSYCGSNGYYQCDQNDNCQLVSSSCPSGGTGYTCTSNTDCAAGCYCSNGECTEGGFCGSNGDCGSGYTCDTQRSSCEPIPPPPPGCTKNSDCSNGDTCDVQTGQCVAPPPTLHGVCVDASATCDLKMPVCPEHEVATTYQGCWTGQCEAIGSCNTTPACDLRQHEDDCSVDSSCAVVTNGIDCTTSTGAACNPGDTGCTCKEFVFASCTNKSSGSGSGG